MYDLIEQLYECELFNPCRECKILSICKSKFHNTLHSVYYTYTSNELRNYLSIVYYAEGEI